MPSSTLQRRPGCPHVKRQAEMPLLPLPAPKCPVLLGAPWLCLQQQHSQSRLLFSARGHLHHSPRGRAFTSASPASSHRRPSNGRLCHKRRYHHPSRQSLTKVLPKRRSQSDLQKFGYDRALKWGRLQLSDPDSQQGQSQ